MRPKMVIEELICSSNGHWDSGCTCFACYRGFRCNRVVRSLCHGKVERENDHPTAEFIKIEKCQCDYNQAGHCCEKKKCAGSNPTPDLGTGECNCADPELRSGEFCEKVKCKNGMTAVKNGNCDCTGSHFTGEYCQTIKCLNGGYSYGNATKCHCPDEGRFYGAHCEFVKCDNGGTPLVTTCVECGIFHRGDYCHVIHSLNLGLVLLPSICLILLAMFCMIKKWPANKAAENAAPGARPMMTASLPRHAQHDRAPQILTTSFMNPTSIHRSSSERLASLHGQSEPGISNNATRTARNGPPCTNDPVSSDPFLDPRLPNYPGVDIDHGGQDLSLPYDNEPPPYELVVKTNLGDE